MDALVTDAHAHPSVWAVRALAGAGVTVRALGPARSAPGLWSRGTRSRAVAPAAETRPHEFGQAVAALAARHGPLVVYPSLEESIEALLEADLPETAVLPWAPGSLAALRDKREMAALAADAGIATPATVRDVAAADLRRHVLDGACVVKPVRKSAMSGVRVVRSAAELQGAIASVPDSEPLILQRLAEGDLIALVVVLARDGRPVARLQQRTVRTWPPDAGGSSLAVTEPVDEALAAAAERMLRSAGYHGLVQLQFMAGAGPPQLIDANPRFYGSLSLALAAGVNLPALWHAVVTGGALPDAPPPYATGVSYRHVALDLTAALHGRARALLRPPPPRVGAMWHRDDPLAGALLATRAAGAYGHRQVARLTRMAGRRRGAGPA
jgi:predicted ATP-grasp superfamily ATP-dependent carboligase